jgi:predicted RNA binding protein YcfA (HicA-like mRNA interferase family)
MGANALLAVLQRAPLNYIEVRRNGSHRVLRAESRPPLSFSFHQGVTIGPRLVRKILVDDVGLTEEEALDLL